MTKHSEKKKCIKCKKEKDINEYFILKYALDGRQTYCKDCERVRIKKYRKQRKLKTYDEPFRTCKDCKVEQEINEFAKHPDARNGHQPVCKDCKKIYRKYGSPNKNKSVELTPEEHQKAKVRRGKWRRGWHKNRMQTTPEYKLVRILRTRILHMIHKIHTSKSQSSMKLLGCSIPFFKTWIESQFTNGMSWENKSDWHVDHQKPCASFDLTDPKEQQKCFNWQNCKPMWAKDNMSKNDTVDWNEIITHRNKALEYAANHLIKAIKKGLPIEIAL